MAPPKRQQSYQHVNPAPKFSGLADGMISFFTKVTEEFVWEFLFQDVVDLWIPRVSISLIRGREKADYNKLPEHVKQRPLEAVGYMTKDTIKGLNYKNSLEETLREVETGPTLFLAPSIIFALAGTGLLGKKALLMNYAQGLKPHKEYYSNWITQLNPKFFEQYAQVHPHLLETKVAEGYMHQQLAHHFNAAAKPFMSLRPFGGQVQAADETLAQFVRKVSLKLGKSAPTYQDVLNHWVKEWVSAAQVKRQFLNRAHDSKVADLYTIFQRTVFHYNLDVKQFGQDLTKWNKVYIPGLYKDGHASGRLLEDNRKFFSFISESLRLARRQVGPYTHLNGWGRGLQGQIFEASKYLLQRMAPIKMILSVLATILVGVSVISVSAVAQRGKRYPANRNIEFSNMPAQPQAHPAFASHQLRQPYPQQAAASFFHQQNFNTKGDKQ